MKPGRFTFAYLRKKLERAGAGGVIQTVRGFGYLLAPGEETPKAEDPPD